MKNIGSITALALWFIALQFIATTTIYAQESLLGAWVGMTKAIGGSRFISVRFETQSDTLSGSLDVPSAEVMRLPMYSISQQGNAIRFSVHSPIGEFSFEGKLQNGVIEGAIQSNTAKPEKLHLVRQTAISEALLTEYMGEYQFSNGQRLHIIPNSLGQCTVIILEQVDSLIAFNRVLTIIPSSEQTFFTSKSAIAPPAEPDETVVFERDANGKVTSLVWKQPNGNSQGAKKITPSYQQELIHFANESNNKGKNPIHLGGLLLTPNTEAKHHPAIVIIPGSGPVMRDNPIAYLRVLEFVSMGYAVLLYDKRGTAHTSGGYFRSSGYGDYASDALAAVDFLKKRNDIDGQRIGLQGNSEAGWTIPLALANTKDVAFAIVASGGGFTCEESELQEVRTLSRKKFSEADIAEAERFVKVKWRYALTSQNWAEYQQSYTANANKEWFQLINGPEHNSPRIWQEMGLRDVDDQRAISALEKISVPVLLLYGDPEKDTMCPVLQSRSAWEAAFKKSNNSQLSISMIPKSGHAVFLRSEKTKTVLVPEAFDAVRTWLLRPTNSSTGK